jgi:Bacterial Ig-like domain (group 2)
VFSSGQTRRLGFVLVFLVLISPIAKATSLTFQHALELAQQHRSPERGTPAQPSDGRDDCAVGDESSLLMTATSSKPGGTDFEESIEFSAAFVTTTRLASSASSSSPEVSHVTGTIDNYRLVCAAILYADLAKLTAQADVLTRQEMAATQLLRIETARVVRGVDDPIALTRAKLLAARTRLWHAEVESSVREIRRRLAGLTGLPANEIEPIVDSMPPLPDVAASSAGMEDILRQVSAARDVAQLEQMLSHAHSLQTRGQLVLVKATLEDLLTSYIVDDENLDRLFELNFELETVQLQILRAVGKLDEWVFADKPTGANVTLTAFGNVPARAPESGQDIAGSGPTVLSIMVTPAVSAMTTAESRQLSATAIYNDGSAKDVTSEAAWRCSSSSKAIVSPLGLVTALDEGQVAISATFSNVTQPRSIRISSGLQEGIGGDVPRF